MERVLSVIARNKFVILFKKKIIELIVDYNDVLALNLKMATILFLDKYFVNTSRLVMHG